jgi:hypothetical protein
VTLRFSQIKHRHINLGFPIKSKGQIISVPKEDFGALKELIIMK